MTRRGRVEGEGEEKREGEVKRLAETLHLPSVTWQTVWHPYTNSLVIKSGNQNHSPLSLQIQIWTQNCSE